MKGLDKRHIPNLLSFLRVVLCVLLFFTQAATALFWLFYLSAGITDVLDGFLARRWKVECLFGARLDSVADFLFVLTAGHKLLPWLWNLPVSLWIVVLLIILIRISNAIVSYHVIHEFLFLHTKANKVAGFLLWMGALTIHLSCFPFVAWIVTFIALFAAIQENILICRSHHAAE